MRLRSFTILVHFLVLNFVSWNLFAAPTADLITGDISVCPGYQAELVIELTGIAPFTVRVTYNVNDTLTYPDIISPNYSIFVSDEGLYELIDVSDDSGEAGAVSGMSYVSFFVVPSAILDGSSQMCQGGISSIPVIFNSGTLPWSITYNYNNVPQPRIDDITTNPFDLPVSTQGQYILTSISDANCSGNIAGIYNVSYYDKPTGNILGNASICQGETTPITFALTGEAPWTITYSRDGITQGTIDSINSSPLNIQVTEAGTYRLVSVQDANCTGNVFGQAIVQILPNPDAQITGLNITYSISDDPVSLTGTPTGGDFSGAGVVSATSMFYPNIAGTAGSPHPIVYEYTNGSGCSDTDTAWVYVIDADAEIIIPDEKPMYCYNDDTFRIYAYNTNDTIGWFSISGGVGLTDNGDNSAIVDPAILNSGNFTITYTYFNGIYLSVYKNISVQYINPLQIFGLSTAQYCQNSSQILITGNTTGGVFSGTGVVYNMSSYYFVPYLADVGINTVTYSYTSNEGCSRSTTRNVTVNANPVVNFTVMDSCVIDQGLQSTQFTNLTTSVDLVSTWLWNFGDINSGVNNTSAEENPAHTYNNSGPRNISLTASTTNCSSSLTKNIDFGDKPFADFYWSTECFDEGIPINFTNQTTCRTPVTDYTWRFYSGSDYDSLTSYNALFLYPDTGEYIVELFASTAYNCSDTFSKVLVLKPTYKIGEDNYLEDFENNSSLWNSDNERLVYLNQWELGTPEGNIIDHASSGTKCWYTNIQDNDEEQSWIVSPCFDFTGVEIPLIRFDLWRAFQANHDGTVLQATSNSGRNWTNVGILDDGINWYNSYLILGEPGNQSYGWSDIIDQDWINASHSLEEFIDQTGIQFRFAYGSDGKTPSSEGFAVDNIFVGESKKTLLLESFVNSYQDISLTTDSDMMELLQTYDGKMVGIQYHTGFEGDDQQYLSNRSDVNARSLFYGISSSSFLYVDGGFEEGLVTKYNGETIDQNVVSKRALVQPFIDLDIHAGYNSGFLNGYIKLIALEDVPLMGLNLQIALLSDSMLIPLGGSNSELWHAVMCKLLPDGGGTSYYRSWGFGDSDSVFFSYEVPGNLNTDSLFLVAFLQNEVSKDIIQARSEHDLTEQIVIPKSFNGNNKSAENGIKFYPNPAIDRINILLEAENHDIPESSNIEIKIMNTLGQVLFEYTVPNAFGIYELPLNLPPNIYLLSATYPDGRQVSEKLIIR